ncbi:hypothetical protein Ddye_012404 [Dipteronia dyeriana]|uniref:Uncharacterized protein n=1 Tax=Dipteronia dyeriana TaxID=168575 RepID=A0AAD9X4A0_9ROSI|nr:hypothetical protein Ddye_012404 [Dipteronia dyeriana]
METHKGLLFEELNWSTNKRRRGWDDEDFGLSVLHSELDSHAEAPLVFSGFTYLIPKPNRPPTPSHIRVSPSIVLGGGGGNGGSGGSDGVADLGLVSIWVCLLNDTEKLIMKWVGENNPMISKGVKQWNSTKKGYASREKLVILKGLAETHQLSKFEVIPTPSPSRIEMAIFLGFSHIPPLHII